MNAYRQQSGVMARCLSALFFLAMQLGLTTAFAQGGNSGEMALAAEANTKGKEHLGIKGFDPVAYFTGDHAVKGLKELTSEYQGITYRFSTETNRDVFVKDPAKYTPAYGGWCASAMAFGRKVDIDPESYIVEDGRLFLFYLGFRGDAKKDWLKNQPKWKSDADSEWHKVENRVRGEAA